MMGLELVARFVSEILRIFSARGFWCALMQMVASISGVTRTSFVVPNVPIGTYPIHYVAVAGEDTVVVSFRVGPGRMFHRDITNLATAGLQEPVSVPIPGTMRSTWVGSLLSDALSVNGKEWWYATLDDRDQVAATTFVRSDGSRATFPRPLAPAVTPDTKDLSNSNSWQMVTVPGEKPRVLHVAYLVDATLVTELDWSGASRSWRLPPLEDHPQCRMVAQPLADKRIALISNHGGLTLYLLADQEQVDVIPLRNVRVQQFDAALDDTGRLAIVAARNAIPTALNDTGTIDAAILDPAHPGSPNWFPIRHDVRVGASVRKVQVVPTSTGFAAAWLNELDGKHLEATSIDQRGHGGSVVEVGQPTPRGVAFFSLQAKDDSLFFWWDDGERLLQRQLPMSLRGFALLHELSRLLCGENAE